MGRALGCCALLLLALLGPTAGGQTCRLDRHGAPLSDHPVQCPVRLEVSGEPALDRDQRSPESPGKAGADNPPAEEGSLTWAVMGGASAEEVSRSPADPADAGTLAAVEGAECHRWAQGQASPIATFRCPTGRDPAEDTFCCGSCTASFCCASPKDRLEQASCSRALEEAADGGAGESTLPPPGKPATFKILAMVFIVAGVLCVCLGILYSGLHFREWIIFRRVRRSAREQWGLGQETPPAAGTPTPGQAASGDPHWLLLRADESPRAPELPPAMANPPEGEVGSSASAGPMEEMAVFPVVLPEGNLEAPPEEEDTAL